MPNFTRTKVDESGMRSTANQIDNDLSSLAASFQRISSAIDALAPTWEGPSKDLFYAQYKTDSEGYAAHMQAVKLLNDKLREATGIYMGAESNVGTAVNKIKAT